MKNINAQWLTEFMRFCPVFEITVIIWANKYEFIGKEAEVARLVYEEV